MPKLIPELREHFLDAARKRMREDGERDFTISQIAADCQTAVGTVYNYFPSKQALFSAVMREDLEACVRRVERVAEEAEGPLDGLRQIFSVLREFTLSVFPYWEHYCAADKSPVNLLRFKDQVTAAMDRPISRLLLRFDLLFDPGLPQTLAEMLLVGSDKADGFDRIEPTLKKLLK